MACPSKWASWGKSCARKLRFKRFLGFGGKGYWSPPLLVSIRPEAPNVGDIDTQVISPRSRYVINQRRFPSINGASPSMRGTVPLINRACPSTHADNSRRACWFRSVINRAFPSTRTGGQDSSGKHGTPSKASAPRYTELSLQKHMSTGNKCAM